MQRDRAIDEAFDYMEHGAALLEAGDFDSAIEHLQKATALAPELPQTWFHLGIAYDDSGAFDQAVDSYNRAIRLQRDFPEAWNNLGFAHHQREAWASNSVSPDGKSSLPDPVP
mgnify:CR=1 FL=1